MILRQSRRWKIKARRRGDAEARWTPAREVLAEIMVPLFGLAVVIAVAAAWPRP